MRFSVIAVAMTILIAAAVRPVSAAPQRLELSADRVDYFSNRFIVTGDGNVVVRQSDGVVVRGETFAMDLKLDRFVVAGNVRVSGPGIDVTGAGWAGFPELDRSYLLTAGGAPDRWTYAGADYAHELKGREQPGDAFYLPDLSAEKPFIKARSARIFLRNAIELRGASVYTFGLYTPVYNYVVNFSGNSGFAQNGLAGAQSDVGIPFHGTSDALSALHVRYDSLRGVYLAFDQHFVRGRDYGVVSVNPFTQHYRQFNVIGYHRQSQKLEEHFFYQLNTEQSELSQPLQAASYAQLIVNVGLRRSGLSLSMNQYNYGLNHPFIDAPIYNAVRHPSQVGVDWTGFETRIATSPLYYRLRSSYSVSHDTYGLGTFVTTPYDSLWQRIEGVTLYTHALRLSRVASFTASTDKQRDNYSLPAHIDQTLSTGTLAFSYPKSSTSLTYQVRNIGAYYGANQLVFYPPAADVQTSQFGTYSGFGAFRGFATYRSWIATQVWTPSQNFALNLQLRRSYDFPNPVQGFGGDSPWQFTGDVRVRLARQILLDLTRSYYFNFAAQRWQPQFGIQFSP